MVDSEELPDGNIEFVTENRLHTQTLVFHIPICRKWIDKEKCIYRSTVPAKKIGYEIFWEYVDAVNFGKQKFSGFVKAMDRKYQMWRIFPTHFMQLNYNDLLSGGLDELLA